MARCTHCGGATAYEPDVLSEICTDCGVLVDGSQTVLQTDEFEPGHASGSSRAGFRIRSYRDPSRSLPGDSATHERHASNTDASHAYIRELASQLGASRYAERATGIFTQAMTAGQFKWGRKSKLVSCAALAAAQREASKPHSLLQIAHLAGEEVKFTSLTRTYAQITELLKLKLPLSHPLDSIPMLHKHTLELLDASPSVLPADLQCELERALGTKKQRERGDDARARETARLASCLASLELPPGHHHVTACAVYVLAVEGTRRAKLPAFRGLADHLAHHTRAGTKATRARYNELAIWLHERVKAVPWLKQAPTRQKKVDERDVVARSLPDLVKFHAAILVTRATSPVILRIDPDSEADEDSSGSEAETDAPTTVQPLHAKKRKTSPNDVPGPSKKAKKLPATDAAVHSLLVSSGIGHHLHAYYLTCSDHQLENRRPPSRLELLCAERGGEEAVEDDELFADGELEGIFRSEEERETLPRWMHEQWAYAPKVQPEAAREKRLPGHKKRTKAGEGWEHAIDIALGRVPVPVPSVDDEDDSFEHWGKSDDDGWAKSDDGKAVAWDEDLLDRNWAPTLSDAHDWLADF